MHVTLEPGHHAAKRVDLLVALGERPDQLVHLGVIRVKDPPDRLILAHGEVSLQRTLGPSVGAASCGVRARKVLALGEVLGQLPLLQADRRAPGRRVGALRRSETAFELVRF